MKENTIQIYLHIFCILEKTHIILKQKILLYWDRTWKFAIDWDLEPKRLRSTDLQCAGVCVWESERASEREYSLLVMKRSTRNLNLSANKNFCRALQ